MDVFRKNVKDVQRPSLPFNYCLKLVKTNKQTNNNNTKINNNKYSEEVHLSFKFNINVYFIN